MPCPLRFLAPGGIVRTGVQGDPEATRLATELNDAMSVLSTFDGVRFVLYTRIDEPRRPAGYDSHFNASDALSPSQKPHLHQQWHNSRTGGRLAGFFGFLTCKIHEYQDYGGRSICPCTRETTNGRAENPSTQFDSNGALKPMPG